MPNPLALVTISPIISGLSKTSHLTGCTIHGLTSLWRQQLKYEPPPPHFPMTHLLFVGRHADNQLLSLRQPDSLGGI